MAQIDRKQKAARLSERPMRRLMPAFGRWLCPEDCAAYIGERVDRLPRLLRVGKLPAPSFHLGPPRPRYDRDAIDALFAGCSPSSSHHVSLTQLMNSWLERIGLPSDLNVHGLRKLVAASLADAGCTTHEIAAITGHKSLAMIELNTKSANQERLAKAAIIRLVSGSENAGNSNPKPLNNKVISC